jgi:hypothetical protein
MKFKILAPYMLALGAAPAAFAFPVVGGRGSSIVPPTIGTIVVKSVTSPTTIIASTVMKGATIAPPTIVSTIVKGATTVVEGVTSPTTFVINTLTNPDAPSVFKADVQMPTATYVPASNDETLKNEPSAETDKTPQAESKAEATEQLMIIEEPKPVFRASDSCEQVNVKTIDLTPVVDAANLKKTQETTTAVMGSIELYPTANGQFVRHKLLNTCLRRELRRSMVPTSKDLPP